MALIVGNLASNLEAESAVSVAGADMYHGKRGNDAWLAFDETRKEQLLIKGADYIRATFGLVWNAPTIAALAAPLMMMQANAELALLASSGDLLSNPKRGKKKVKVGPIEVQYDGDSPTQTEFVLVNRRLASLLVGVNSGISQAKLIRC